MVDLKELKTLIDKTDENDISFNYIEKCTIKDDSSQIKFESYYLDIVETARYTLKNELNKKIQKFLDKKYEVVEFNPSVELSTSQIGKAILEEQFSLLNEIITASQQPNKKFSSRDANHFNKLKKGIICYVIKINDIFLIKHINLISIFKTNRKKVYLGLYSGKIKNIDHQFIILSPDNFDIIYYKNDNTFFVIHEREYHYLFSDTEVLIKKILATKDNLANVIYNSDILIDYAKRNPTILRGLYYLSYSKLKQLDKNYIKAVEDKIKKQKNLPDNEIIFELINNKIKCTKENIKYVYNLLMKKYAKNLYDDRLFISGSEHKI